jgi:hypothetical protein
VSTGYANALGASRILLKVMRVLNLATGLAFLACLVASFLFEPAFVAFFSKQPPRIDPGLLMPILRVWVVLTAPLIAVVHISLSRLLEMVDTVREGDPFVPENAARMKTIAWCVLATQIYHLFFGLMVALVNAAGSRMEWSFSPTGWLAVVLLFVLALVFEQGTRIRADLEAMI